MQPFLQNLYFCKILRAFGGSQRFHFLRARGPQALGLVYEHLIGVLKCLIGVNKHLNGAYKVTWGVHKGLIWYACWPHAWLHKAAVCLRTGIFCQMRLGLRSEWPFLKPMSLWISFLMFSNKEFNYLKHSIIKMKPCNYKNCRGDIIACRHNYSIICIQNKIEKLLLQNRSKMCLQAHLMRN